MVISSLPEIPSEKKRKKKKTLAYILRTGYHPLSSAPSSALFRGKHSLTLNKPAVHKESEPSLSLSLLFFYFSTFIGNL